MSKLTEITAETIKVLTDGTKIVADVTGIDYEFQPDLRDRTIEVEEGTLTFLGVGLSLIEPDGRKTNLMYVERDSRIWAQRQNARIAPTDFVDEWLTAWLVETIEEYENERHTDADFDDWIADAEGDRAYDAYVDRKLGL